MNLGVRFRDLLRASSVATTLALCALCLQGRPAHADTCEGVSPSCSFDHMGLQPLQMQPVPSGFKFQARVSQAKLPVGNAVFEKVFVNLKRSNGDLLCTETIEGVVVTDSVLNLDIGPGMTHCDIEGHIAKQAGLSFQICINSPSNCLKSVPLRAVPYAVKSNVALLAEKADKANQAVQCHYTHRAAADLATLTDDLSGSDTPRGTGYYDFTTPGDVDSLGYGGATNLDGYITWNPVLGENRVHICRGNADALANLAELVLHADSTTLRGRLVITTPDGEILAQIDNANTALNTPQTSVNGDLTVAGGARFTGTDKVVDFSQVREVRFDKNASGLDEVISTAMPDIIGGEDGPTLPRGQIVDGSVGTSDLAAYAVTEDKIDEGAVSSFGILNGTVDSIDLAPYAVTGAKLDTDAVTTDKIANHTIRSEDIGNYTIKSEDLGFASVTGSKIENDAVDHWHLNTDAVRSWHINDSSVYSRHIADTQIRNKHFNLGWSYHATFSTTGTTTEVVPYDYQGDTPSNYGNFCALRSFGVGDDGGSCSLQRQWNTDHYEWVLSIFARQLSGSTYSTYCGVICF